MALLTFRRGPEDTAISTRLRFTAYTPFNSASATLSFFPIVSTGISIEASASDEEIPYTPTVYAVSWSPAFTGSSFLRISRVQTFTGIDINFAAGVAQTLSFVSNYFAENPLPAGSSAGNLTITVSNTDTSDHLLAISDYLT